MDPIIIMVGRINEGVHDIEVMPNIPAVELADAIALAFGWPGTYDIQVAGKTLAANRTLADADIWDGTQLTLIASNRPPLQASATGRTFRIPDQSAQDSSAPVTGVNRYLQIPGKQSVVQDGPVVGKRTLQTPDDSQSVDDASPATGWKPVVPEPPAPTPLSSPVTGWRQPSISPETLSKNDDQQP